MVDLRSCQSGIIICKFERLYQDLAEIHCAAYDRKAFRDDATGWIGHDAGEFVERDQVPRKRATKPGSTGSLRPHPDLPRLLKTIKTNLTLAAAYSATVYRLAHQDWSSEQHLLSGEGSRIHGGRWNPRASLLRLATASKPRVTAAPRPRERARALAERLLIEGFNAAYTSLELETCLIEHLWYAKRFAAGSPLPDDYWEDYRLGVVAVNLERVLDLTSNAVLSALGLRPELLIAEWLIEQRQGDEALTQAIGRAARVNALQGLIVPSARRAGFANLAIFPDNCHERQCAQILGVQTISQDFRSFL